MIKIDKCKFEQIKEKAPLSGFVLAYMRKEVIFRGYDRIEELADLMLENEELLELHLFNEEKELRFVSSNSRRYKEKYIEHLSNFAIDEDTYCERVMLEKSPDNRKFLKYITIANHIGYDEESGMAYIDDYRLMIGDN